MARHKEDSRPPSKSKMTVMVFQLEGSDETIQEGLRRVSESVQGMVRPIPKLLAKSDGGGGHSGNGEAEGINANDVTEPESSTEPEQPDSDENQKPRVTREHREKPLQYVAEIEPAFKSAKVKIEQYVKDKKAGDLALRRTLVCAMWLRDQGNISEFTADHIYTCFKILNWTNTPDNPRKFLSNMRSRERCFEKGSKVGLMKLNHRGEKMVEDGLNDS